MAVHKEKLLFTRTVTIADAASLSDAVDLGQGQTLVGVLTDSGWNAAKISFQAATTLGGTYYPVCPSTGTQSETGSVTGAKMLSVQDFSALLPVRYLKVRSGTDASPVAQTGATVVTLITTTI